ncbi:MAG: thrombospondin type 3 repeat-containing protein [Bacteroidota bacterium]
MNLQTCTTTDKTPLFTTAFRLGLLVLGFIWTSVDGWAQRAVYESNGSDYTVTASWSGIASSCCEQSTTASFYVNNSRKKNGSGRSGSVSLVVGPSTNHHYRWKYNYSGKDETVCIFGCSGEVGLSTGYRVRTSAIKRPTTLAASSDKVGSIVITWARGTNIPNGSHQYRIYRDGLEAENRIATVSGSTRTYTDNEVGPGEIHNYYISTYTSSWSGHESGKSFVRGSTISRQVDADDGLGRSIKVSWEDLSELGEEIDIYRDDVKLERIESSINNYQDRDPDLIPGFRHTYVLRPVRSGVVRDFPSLSDTGYRKLDGIISGYVNSPRNAPIENVQVCAERIEAVEQGPVGVQYCDTTDASGFYEITDIYYYDQAAFRIRPAKEDHGFRPGSLDRTLRQQTPILTNINFTDTTSFSISGQVVQQLDGTSCGLAGVELLINDVYKGNKTDANGYFSVTAEETGEYTIRPRLSDHTFDPPQQNFFVDKDIDQLSFTNEKVYRLSGHVLAGCQIYLGDSQLRIRSKGDGCFDKRVAIQQGNGRYEVDLPAREYTVEVVQIAPDPDFGLDAQDVIAYFNPMDVDLSEGDARAEFVYRRQPDISISGIDAPICGFDYKVVEQNKEYQIRIELTETFGDETCPVDTGYILVYDELADRKTEPETLYISNGQAIYYSIPKSPNIIFPYTKNLQFVAFVDREMADYSEDFVVTGVRPREQTFTTVTPSMPFMILRDPPGDASYSYLEESSTAELAMSLFGESSGSVEVWDQLKLGTKFQSGIGVEIETEIWGSIKASLEVGARLSESSEYVMSLTNSNYFSTSGNPQITGTDGDVYAGAALNLIYALSDVLSFDPTDCNVKSDVDLIMANDGFATEFLFTEGHIRDVLIPDLDRIRLYYEDIGSDSSAFYANQVSVWEQALAHNAKLKQESSFVENRSFSAGAPYESSTTESSRSTLSYEFSTFVDSDVALEAGLEVGGVGFSGGVSVNLRAEMGESKSSSSMQSRTTGYYLSDDDPGDFFSLNIRNDKVYATPVFELVSGRSSCPYEEGTQPREDVQLQSDVYVQTEVDPQSEAVFRLSLGNISQSDETRTYRLAFLQASNPNGARVRIGGSEAQTPIPYTIGPGTAAQATVTVERGPSAFVYQDLRFALLSGCDDEQIEDIISLSVYFQNECSNINLFQPDNGWVINENSDNRMPIKIRGYDLNLLDRVSLEYADVITGVWTEAFQLEKGDLETGQNGTSVFWNVENVPDGRYLLRLRLDCDQGYVYSQQAEGRIDRVAPQLYARPEPQDGTYNREDVISVTFDETIECLSFDAEQVVVREASSGDIIATEVGCSEDRLIIQPILDFNQRRGQRLEIMVDEVEDLYGNVMPDFVQWEFQIESGGANQVDTDQDGIPDVRDNCRLAANTDQSDIDGDGIGDVCDDDLDGDGIVNADDNCPYHANPNQEDQDNDGIGDSCETTADGDGDGIPNDLDNCPYQPNASQADMDQDGIGDVCDADRDGDGVDNAFDNCPDHANPDQLDSDQDGRGDACESTAVENLPDGIESALMYPNPANGDVFVELQLSEQTEVSLVVLDGLGRALQTSQMHELISGRHQLPLTDHRPTWNPGIYYVKIQSHNSVLTLPLIWMPE